MTVPRGNDWRADWKGIFLEALSDEFGDRTSYEGKFLQSPHKQINFISFIATNIVT